MLRDLVPPPGPVRILAVSGLARTTGFGTMVAVAVLYFTRVADIPPERVGLGMTIAALCGAVASPFAGNLADRFGARDSAIVLVTIQGLAVACYGFVGGFVPFMIAVSIVISCHSSAESARGALVAGIVEPDRRVKTRALLHSVTNVGLSLGALAGGVALQVDTRSVYVGMLIGCGVLFAGSGLVYLRLPRPEPVPRPADGSRWEVLRDRPFTLFIALNVLLVMHDSVLTVVLPLWIAERTNAPVSVYAGILLLNTALVVLFQVRASRGTDNVAGGVRALRTSGVLLAVGCVVYALAAGQPSWLAAVILLVGAAMHVFGELLHGAGSWALAFDLAPEHAHGQYQGVLNMSIQLGGVIGPVLGTAVVMGTGWPGWVVLAVVMLGAGLTAPTVARWASRRVATEPST
ncbi:MFS transporter [Amycolatopsis taiwanensis]|uniref:MFS transporter n=1 Tax=Amycolatopsis taiwanensis TaxID=342230 RepID=A0A9W6R5Y1_9PSEU|nr:MFS transporter [Amycolatopsis taiwanensis]GLY70039.1 MFS transporter [Amycolatopsis taiwanensis]